MAIVHGQREGWLELVLDGMPTPLLLIDPATAAVTFANRAAHELAGGEFPTGAAAEEYHRVYYCTDASGQRIPNDEMPGVRAARGERLEGFEMDWHTPAGVRSLVLDATTIPAAEGASEVVVLTFKDIKDRKDAEAELRAQLDFTGTVLRSLGEGVYAMDAEGRLTMMNPAAEEMLGWREEELRGQQMHDRIHYQHADGSPYPSAGCPLLAAVRGEVVRLEEEPFTRRDGSVFEVLCTAWPLRRADEVVGAVVTFSDVTESRRLERERERFVSLAEQSLDWIGLGGLDGQPQYINPAGRAIAGLEPDEVATTPVSDYCDEATARRWVEEAYPAVMTEGRWDGPATLKNVRTGEQVEMEGTLFLVRDPASGEPQAIAALHRDVTHRHRIERELRLQQQLLQAQSEASLEGMMVVSLSGDLLSYNSRFAELWGFPEDLLASGGDERALDAAMERVSDPEGFRRRVDELYAAEPQRPARDEIALRDGRTLDRYGTPLTGADGKPYAWAWFFRDVTDRKREADHFRFLAEARALLETSLDYEETLIRVAGLAVPHLAEWCSMDMLDAEGIPRRVAATHPDPEKHALALELARRWPTTMEEPAGMGAALRTGRPHLVSDVTPELMEAMAQDEEHARMLHSFRVRSLLAVPLRIADRTIGGLAMATSQAGRRLDETDVALAVELAGDCALAVENARLYREAQALAVRERRNAELLRRLATASLAISSALSLDEVLERITESARELVGAHECVTSVAATDSGEPIHVVSLSEEHEGGREELHAGPGPPTSGGLSVPLVGRRGERLGTLQLRGKYEDEGEWDDEDEAVIVQLAQLASVSIDNARLYDEQSHVARTLQQSLLPRSLPRIPGAEIASAYRPAGRGSEVGGDFYDAFRSGDDHWTLLIGDVCGKGSEAAALTGLARHTLRTAAVHSRRPLDAIATLNGAVIEQSPDHRFCTTAVCALDLSGERPQLTVACGGHPQPLLVRPGGSLEAVGTRGTLVGIVPDPELFEETVELGPGDLLFLYTDGVTDTREAGEPFGEERLAGLARSCAGLSAAEATRRVKQAVLDWAAEPADDIALLVLRIER